jgi:hypothetical protein
MGHTSLGSMHKVTWVQELPKDFTACVRTVANITRGPLRENLENENGEENAMDIPVHFGKLIDRPTEY